MDGTYLNANPDWHVSDSPRKADWILRAIRGNPVVSICEVGCGGGEILRRLALALPTCDRFVGYDISPDAITLAATRANARLEFRLMNAAEDSERFDLMLLVDVIEHVPDPIWFAKQLRFKARRTLFHVPLDLSAQSVLRPSKLLAMRTRVGHIHYFTQETALATIADAGYSVQRYWLTPTYQLGARSFKGRLANVARTLTPARMASRVLGGYSLLVDATNGLAHPR